jgi:hypothetical protein
MTAKILLFPATTKPHAEPVIEGEVIAAELVPADATTCDRPKRRKQRARMRVEQIEVTCERVPRKQHRDLRGLHGVLTIDWKGATAWTATFDPDDENVPNIVAPVENLKRDAETIEIACDEGTWAFAPISDDETDDDETDEE